jgi:hypothetical protein
MMNAPSGSYSATSSSAPRRTAWMAARARNAAKRGWLISAIGLLALVSTLLLLILVPREVNRSVRARLDALPPLVDTMPLQANLTGATDRLRNAEASLQLLLQADADRIASATGNTPTDANSRPAEVSIGGEQSDARRELSNRVARARTAPLVENYRAVGEAEMLRGDARVRAALDSLNDVNRDREAYAALGGPDARYAAMTSKLTALGQRLISLGEQRLASSAGSGAPANAAPAPPARTGTAASNDSGRGGVASQPTVDTTFVASMPRMSSDTVAERFARETLDSAKVLLQQAERALADARASNARINDERKQAEADSPARVPPVAMLFAALIVGLAVGFGFAFFIEVRRPRVADAAEVERVTDARVIVHAGSQNGSRGAKDATPRIVDASSESFQLLHVTLTGYGDTSREVQVISSDALLGAAVGINLGAAAARDSRATLLVDTSTPPKLVSRLLGAAENTAPRGQSASLQSRMASAPVGPSLSVDTLTLVGHVSDDVQAELQELAHEHDFTVVVRNDHDDVESTSPLPATDVILCARVGVTRLDWLMDRVRELRAQQYRVRAVLLWSARAPGGR